MGLLTDAVGNVLSEGQLVHVTLQGGGYVVGRIGKLDQGGYHAVLAAGEKPESKPALVVVVAEVPTWAKPGSAVPGILVIQEPNLPRAKDS